MAQDIDYLNYENVDLGASFESAVINIVPFKGGYIQLVATGAPVGSLVLQASNDPGPLQAVNWETIPYSSMLINGAGRYVYNLQDAYSRYLKLVYTRTSGTGTCSIRIQLKD